MSDEQIIVALISNPSIAEASKCLSITPQTIYNKLRDADFRERYAEARREALEQNCFILQSYLSDAIEKIHEIVVDDIASDQVRLNACDMLLRHCYRLTELTDILVRLEKVEKLMEANNEQ